MTSDLDNNLICGNWWPLLIPATTKGDSYNIFIYLPDLISKWLEIIANNLYSFLLQMSERNYWHNIKEALWRKMRIVEQKFKVWFNAMILIMKSVYMVNDFIKNIYCRYIVLDWSRTQLWNTEIPPFSTRSTVA